MMMGFGFLVMLAVLAVPILLVVGLILLAMRPVLDQVSRSVVPGTPSPATTVASTATICSHCGARLQAGWVHCPQCGAPTGSGE